MWNLIFVRLWRERRTMAVLLLGMCLVTGFLALSPLYVEAIAAADLEQRLESASDRRFLVPVSHTQPLEPQSQQIAQDTLGRFLDTLRPYRSVDGFQCGLIYKENTALADMNSSTPAQCYRPYSYPAIEEVFNVVAGRAPDIIPPDSDRYADVEAVITVTMAEEVRLNLDDYIIIGQEPDSAVIVQIVGLTQPILPESDVFWQTQTVLDAYWTDPGNGDIRFDVSPVMQQEAFEQHFSDVYPITYYWQINLKRNLISINSIDDIDTRLNDFTRTLPQTYPDVNISNRFQQLVDDYRAGIEAARGPVLLLSFLVMVLMLYNLVTISTLILEQQNAEWAMFASRGGSVAQLIGIQFISTGVLALIAGLLGVPVAYLILLILSVIGPQSAILTSLPGTVPALSIGLSAGAALIILLVLLLPAWRSANSSALYIQRGFSRPPVQPVWARFFLDVICLGIGAAFILRLYALSTDAGFGALLQNPALLIDVLSQQGATRLSDPFNIAGPALLLTGIALLWMRIFPLLMQAVGGVFDSSDGLTARLAFWNVERNPAHYAQLVLLMIGTLALGTASLALSQTRDVGAWQAALTETGAEASLEFNPRQIDRSTDWQNLPGVNDALPFLYAVAGTNRDQALIGLPLTELTSTDNSGTDNGFALQSESLNALQNAAYGDEGGILLPENARSIQIDIYPEAPDESGDITTVVSLRLIDYLGFETDVSLQSVNADPTTSGEFITYAASLQNAGEPPLQLTEIRLDSTHSEKDEFQHQVYLDNLRTINADNQTESIVPFESSAPDNWNWPSALRRQQILESAAFSSVGEPRTQGETSMSVRYNVRQSGVFTQGGVLRYYDLAQPPVPAVISAEVADEAGQRSRFRRPLEVGDTISSRWTVPAGQTASATIEINYTVVDIVEQFPGLADPDG